MTRYRRTLATIVALAISHTVGLQAAQAGMIGTAEFTQSTLARAADSATRRAEINSLFERADVAQELARRGVDIGEARARVAALSDAELADMAKQIDEAPAGGDFLGVVVGIFLILLITDILGFTKIFPFTRSIR
ncbi:MAG: hypothetical protein EPO12_21150 [Aquabacterium sp.]|jgi:hypothetical protein|nr:MAG: hypothetical protein EPO12_21150 [Aquabacterium sp.]